MTTKATDIVLPPATTELEDFNRWRNTLSSRLRALPYHNRKQIDVLAISVTTTGEVSWGKDTRTSRWVAGVSFSYD